MLRGAQRGSALLRSSAVVGARGRCPRAVFAAAADARSGFVVRSQQAKSEGAFRSANVGQARWMSAAAPGSADSKKDEPKPEPGGFLRKLMSKENCVVSAHSTVKTFAGRVERKESRKESQSDRPKRDDDRRNR